MEGLRGQVVLRRTIGVVMHDAPTTRFAPEDVRESMAQFQGLTIGSGVPGAVLDSGGVPHVTKIDDVQVGDHDLPPETKAGLAPELTAHCLGAVIALFERTKIGHIIGIRPDGLHQTGITTE